MHAGPWEGSVETFAKNGFQCLDFKYPTDYYMAVASNPENHAVLLAEQEKRTLDIAKSNASADAAALAKPNDIIREVRAHTSDWHVA